MMSEEILVTIKTERHVRTRLKLTPIDRLLEKYIMKVVGAWDRWTRQYIMVMSEMEDLII